jgi:hypothetical protein
VGVEKNIALFFFFGTAFGGKTIIAMGAFTFGGAAVDVFAFAFSVAFGFVGASTNLNPVGKSISPTLLNESK